MSNVALLRPRSEVEEALDRQIDRGHALLEGPVESSDAVQAARDAYYTWSDYNLSLIQKMFTGAGLNNEYTSTSGPVFFLGGGTTLAKEVADLRSDIQKKLRVLASIRSRVELFEAEEPRVPDAAGRTSIATEHFHWWLRRFGRPRHRSGG